MIIVRNNWTVLVIASLMMCLVSSFAAVAQTNASKVLDEGAVAALLDELKAGLPDLIDDEDQVTAIMEKWDAREDLGGKTKSQILSLLIADVKSVVNDKETQNKIWSSWTEEGGQPAVPVPTPMSKQPNAQSCPSGTIPGPDGSCVPQVKAQTPDLSGTWILNKAASKLNDQFDMAPKDIVVAQGANELVIERHSVFDGRDLTVKDKFTLDGRESINPGWADSQKRSTAVWSGDKASLMITTKLSMGDNGDMTVIETYRLKDGHLVIEARSSSSFGERAETLIFDRK